MKRREFLKTGTVAVAGGAILPPTAVMKSNPFGASVSAPESYLILTWNHSGEDLETFNFYTRGSDTMNWVLRKKETAYKCDAPAGCPKGWHCNFAMPSPTWRKHIGVAAVDAAGNVSGVTEANWLEKKK